MPLSQLAVVSNFCSNSLPPFLLIIRILSSEAILLQILLYTLFTRFPWVTLHLFPSNFSLHNLMYLGIDVSTHDITIPPQMAFSYHIINLHSNAYLITKDISWHPINQSHPTHLDHTMLHSPRNLTSSETVSSHVSQQVPHKTTSSAYRNSIIENRLLHLLSEHPLPW